MALEVVIIFSILGMICYGVILKYSKLDEKHEAFFWIAVFAPLFIINVIDFDNERVKNALYSFFGAIIVMQVVRNKIAQKAKEAMASQKIIVDNKELYTDPKKKKKRKVRKKKEKKS